MKCPNCGFESTGNFCQRCGAALVQTADVQNNNQQNTITKGKNHSNKKILSIIAACLILAIIICGICINIYSSFSNQKTFFDNFSNNLENQTSNENKMLEVGSSCAQSFGSISLTKVEKVNDYKDACYYDNCDIYKFDYEICNTQKDDIIFY